MGRQRKTNIEKEYELERQIQDLKQEISKLKRKNKEYEKKLEDFKIDKPEKKEIKVKECPDCGGKVKIAPLAFGTLEICEKACGYRQVTRS